MSQVLFVSDSKSIVNLLFNSFFLPSYYSFYKPPVFDSPELASEHLLKNGIRVEDPELCRMREVFEHFNIGKEEFIPDLILLLNVFKFHYETQKENNSNYNEEQYKYLTEFKEIIEILREYDTRGCNEDTNIRIKIGSKKANISEKWLVNDVLRSVKATFRKKEYKLLLSLLEMEGGERAHINVINLFPVANTASKDNLKNWMLKQSSTLLWGFLIENNLFGLSDKGIKCSNEAAKFIGVLLSTIGFIKNETEFKEEIMPHSNYASYDKYLAQMIKSYLPTGRK